MYGGFNAIISQLAEKIGEPFSSFPAEATWYGMGGITRWGTVCGALNGMAFAVNLVVPQEDVEAVCNEVIEWHNRAKLPSKDLDSYVGSKTIVQNVADSPLCHISRSKFEAHNPTEEEIKHRCSKLTGDVARKAVLVLNEYHKGTFVDKFAVSQGVAECKSCHPGAKSYGMMDCTPCHDDHNK
ncbi:MAG TPA: C_GCAxxG_C_C family protein [Firmicutes bacterium]|nr:C_GCAxxG_C_C family protein [Bacillota bacterium]